MRHVVTEADTAQALGSGDVPVLATPRVVAWMEAATVAAAAPLLREGQTTVGTAVRVRHRRASAVGDAVDVTADPPAGAGGGRLTFAVRAVDGAGRLVADGEVDRAVVERRAFLAAVTDTDG